MFCDECAYKKYFNCYKFKYMLFSWLECVSPWSKFNWSGGRFKNTYELLNLRALKFSPVNKIRIFQCMGIRKSKDYVYGIWVYKALDIWKGYYRVKKSSLVSYVKPWTEARNNKYMKYHSKLTYQLSFWNVIRKVDYHAGGKWFIHGPKRRKENQLLSLKHSCWLSLV